MSQRGRLVHVGRRRAPGGAPLASEPVAENLALRQQLAILRRHTKRARLTPLDRAFWIVLSRAWSRWAQSHAIVKPETVIRWHRRGFARFWAWKSKRRGRPPIKPEIIRAYRPYGHRQPSVESQAHCAGAPRSSASESIRTR